MVPALFFSQLVLIALLWLRLMLQWTWPSDRATTRLTPPHPTPPRGTRSREPKPFAGLTRTPHCDACAHTNAPRLHAPFSPATPHRHGARTPSCDRHLTPLLPQPGLCRSRLGGMG